MSHDTLQQASQVGLSLTKTFLVAFLTIVLSAQQGILTLTEPTWKAALNAGAGAVLMVIYNWLNPNDKRYGNGYEPQ